MTGGTGPAVSLSATTIAFGTEPVGATTASQTVTMTNTGSATLTITSIVLGGANPSSYVFSNSCGTSLAAGANCTIHGHFSPTTSGSLPATITITDNAAGSPQTISLTGTGGGAPAVALSASTIAFGSEPVGATTASQTVTMTNSGSGTLTISSIVLGGANPSSYAFSNSCGSSLAAGANCTIHGHFSPTTTGSLPATITISDNAVGSPQTISLTGTGGTTPAASLSATTIAFGSEAVGSTTASQTVTLTNSGSGTLSISSIVLGGTNPSSYAFSNSCGSSLAAGANCTIHGHFSPTTSGSLPATITITDNAAGSPQTIALTGTGTGAGGGGGCTDTILCAIQTASNNIRANGSFGPGNPAPSAEAGGALVPLTWNTAAATNAQNWAAQCNFSHNPNLGAQGFGENIYAAGSGSTPVAITGTDVENSWASEAANYTYSSNTCAAGQTCGHYTQLVWRNTTSAGCAVQQCTTNSPFGASFPDWAFAVCDYAPAGNVNGQLPY